MAFELIVRDSALKDSVEIILYYEKLQDGLGARFTKELNLFLLKIQQMPRRFRSYTDSIFYANMKIFPYQIFFEIVEEENAIYIDAIFHKKQDPNSKVIS